MLKPIKTIGQHTLRELLPHMEDIATQYQLKINRVKDLNIIRKILVMRFYNIPAWEEL
jgi:hypothetical protein